MNRRPFLRTALSLALGTLVLATLPAQANRLATLEVYDRTAERPLPVYWHQGRAYVEGQPGNEYRLTVRNQAGEDLLAVVSVDGVNVVTGETASPQQSGYVIDTWQAIDVSGWRKSLYNTAAFYFTSVSDSYAGRTGRPAHTGVIGVALYRRKVEYVAPPVSSWAPWRNDSAAPAAKAERDGPAAPPASAPQSSQLGQSGDSRARALESPYSSAPMPREEKRLGTGHGRVENNAARRVEFERATAMPEETLTIYYDSRANLVARGVIREPRWYGYREPQPFPNGFAPDPPGR